MTMTAFGLRRRPGVGELETALERLTLPLPDPGRKQVRVRVRAASINIDDRHMAEGTMFGGLPVGRRPKPDAPIIPGLDLAGVVESAGEDAGFQIGDEVFGMTDTLSGRGSWASHVCVSTKNLHLKPSSWSWSEAGALGVSSLVSLALIRAAEPVSGQRIVVVGASGGIGGVTTKILTQLGAEVIGVCSGANAEFVRSLGAARVVDYTRGGFGEQLASEGVAVDRVLDLVGGLEVEAARLLDARGHFLTAVGPHAFVGERKLGFGELVGMLAHCIGRSLVSRVWGPRWRLVGGQRMDWSALERLILTPDLRPQIERVLPLTLDGLREGNRLVASHRARGKVMLEPESSD